MVKIEPLELPQYTKFEFLEYLNYYGWLDYYEHENVSMDYLYDYHNNYLTDDLLDWFQSQQLSRIIFEEYFNGDWRKGQEIFKVVITQRLYQISQNSTQAWFLDTNFTIDWNSNFE